MYIILEIHTHRLGGGTISGLHVAFKRPQVLDGVFTTYSSLSRLSVAAKALKLRYNNSETPLLGRYP